MSVYEPESLIGLAQQIRRSASDRKEAKALLKSFMEQARLTVSGLAARIDVDQRTIRRWLDDGAVMRASHAQTIEVLARELTGVMSLPEATKLRITVELVLKDGTTQFISATETPLNITARS